MPFEISANPVALNVYNNLAVHQSTAATALAKISSGEKAADPSQVAITGAAVNLKTTLAGTQSAITSTQNAINVLQVADTAYAEALGLAQQGLGLANDRLVSGADTSAIDAQLTSVSAGIASIASNTQYNGTAVLGTALTASVNSAGATMTVTPDAIAAVANTASRVNDFTTAINTITDSRAENAGNIAALQNTLQVLEATVSNQQAAVSQILDADMAMEMMSLTSANILTDAATAMVAQAMQMPTSVLKLL
jgi:flagellin